jgi:hypothetical protein
VTDVHLQLEMKQQGKEHLTRIKCATSPSVKNVDNKKSSFQFEAERFVNSESIANCYRKVGISNFLSQNSCS